MIRLLKWFGILVLSIILVSSGFAFYAYFLVDYSLENLETALAATDPATQYSPVVDSVYNSMLDDAVIHEVTADKVNIQNLIISEATARSFQESLDRNGRGRARIYLKNLTKNKKNNQPLPVKFLNFLQQKWARLTALIGSFSRYFQKKIVEVKDKRSAAAEGARFVLLSKAQNFEKEKKYTQAAALYRQYLTLYSASSDKGFVMVALANLLIKSGRVMEADRLFRDIQHDYAGRIEAKIAAQGMRKIVLVNENSKLVDKLKYAVAAATETQNKESLSLDLAAAYISIYRFDEAEKVLKGLLGSKDAEISRDAYFKLGWVYKQERSYKESATLFQGLLKKGVPYEMELGIRAELADIYYRLKQPKMALEQYAFLNQKISKNKEDSSAEVWKGLSAVEQANIYYFDLKDASKAQEQLSEASELFFGTDTLQADTSLLAKDADLRARAFRALRANQLGLAYELFSRFLITNPDDGWGHAGLATVHILLGDVKEATKHIEKAYAMKPDEYTASLVGYLNGIRKDYKAALSMYETALGMNNSYMPAQFNMTVTLIKLKKYEEAINELEKMDISSLSTPAIVRAKIMNNTGYALWETGRQEQALEKFEKAVKIEPDYTTAAKNLKLLQGLKQTQK